MYPSKTTCRCGKRWGLGPRGFRKQTQPKWIWTTAHTFPVMPGHVHSRAWTSLSLLHTHTQLTIGADGYKWWVSILHLEITLTGRHQLGNECTVSGTSCVWSMKLLRITRASAFKSLTLRKPLAQIRETKTTLVNCRLGKIVTPYMDIVWVCIEGYSLRRNTSLL